LRAKSADQLRDLGSKVKGHITLSFLVRKFFTIEEDNVEKYGTAKQVQDNNLIWRMRIACYVTKAKDALRICSTYCLPLKPLLP
jgi:hypothetical protein